MNRITTRKRRGFTLIELLVVVLILSILMAVALPLYLSAVSDSQRKVCRANMQTIANAVQAGRVRTPTAADYSAWIGEALPIGGTVPANLSDLNAVPACPSGGQYSIALGNAAGTFKISCSAAAAHGTFQPGVDSN
jgi:prepilin-type N-terminal cleavage/methylation domain-containing protein